MTSPPAALDICVDADIYEPSLFFPSRNETAKALGPKRADAAQHLQLRATHRPQYWATVVVCTTTAVVLLTATDDELEWAFHQATNQRHRKVAVSGGEQPWTVLE